MATTAYCVKPAVGMLLTFKTIESEPLAGVPGKVVFIWPRFRSGDYLVTLEYAAPVKFRNAYITQIDAFLSELCQLDAGHPARVSRRTLAVLA